MNPERVCYGCFAEKEPGIHAPDADLMRTTSSPILRCPGYDPKREISGRKVLAIGGFGITYLGYDLTLEIKVRLKNICPPPWPQGIPDHYSVALTGRVEEDYQYGMERFLDEAKILAKLQNTRISYRCRTISKRTAPHHFVMGVHRRYEPESLPGKNGDKIPYNQAIAILQPIMEALVQVHALNLLHRDISPDNIYITSKGESRLLDFGAARFALGDGKSVSVILKHGYARRNSIPATAIRDRGRMFTPWALPCTAALPGSFRQIRWNGSMGIP